MDFARLAAGGKEIRTVSPSRALPDKPSIAVLPFIKVSVEPEQEYFADGLVEITAQQRPATQ